MLMKECNLPLWIGKMDVIWSVAPQVLISIRVDAGMCNPDIILKVPLGGIDSLRRRSRGGAPARLVVPDGFKATSCTETSSSPGLLLKMS